MEERKQHVCRGPFHSTPLFVAKAKGSYIEDVDGNTILDFSTGIGVVNTGHCDEAIVGAVKAQADRYLHTSFNILPYEPYIRLCEALNRITPGAYPKKSILVNSGAEAVENAIKVARVFTKRQAIICFDHGFHGRTYMGMALTSKTKPYKTGFGPFPGEIYRAPFPYEYRWKDPAKCSQEAFAEFEDLVTTRVGIENTAAVIIEPVLGEGGFVAIPKDYAAKLREFCTKNGIVLIADEIQAGFGRTGSLFATQAMGITPDLITMAKGLGGGMVVAAVTGRAEMMDAPIEGGLGGTFGGNPLSCAAALEVIKKFEQGGLLAHVKEIENVLVARLEGFKSKFPKVGDVRGLGVMRAIELVKDRTTKEPDREAAAALAKACLARGLVILTCGTNGNIVRLLPPLTISKAELEEGLAIIEKGLE